MTNTPPPPGGPDGKPDAATEVERPPPFLRSWRNVYVIVFAELVLLVAAFYALSRWAA